MLTIVGGLLRSFSYRALGHLFAWQVGVQPNHQLITTGPYAVVRHPSYIALALVVNGTPLALLSSGSYYVEAGLWDSTWGKSVAAAVVGYLWFVAGAFIRRIDEEEAELEKEFGGMWRAWAVKTPYKLIPYVY
ncbi:hypothetical protein BD413DRAFT_501143 [Trametes elegans]|nr:hypothetical protein BD413DRAFT_501143 [Trametes elegans]